MTDAFKCNRCGEYGPRDAPGVLKVDRNSNFVFDDIFTGRKDLCRSCSKEFREFMRGNNDD